MDIESKWAKSTEARLEMFFDDYLIRSTQIGVRKSTERLLLSLFKKANEPQRKKIFQYINNRCPDLMWMGKASLEFLNLIKKIFQQTDQYLEEKHQIMTKIINNLSKIHQKIIQNEKYSFYSLAANLINFGESEFKPYLLEANGSLHCYDYIQKGFENLKLESFRDNFKILGDKVEIEFKRFYEVKDLTIHLKNMNKFKMVSVSYQDLKKQYKKVGRYKNGDVIRPFDMSGSSLLLEFETPVPKKGSFQCMLCGNSQDLSIICTHCAPTLDISGQFKVIGGQEEKIKIELCEYYDKMKNGIQNLEKFTRKIKQSKKISILPSVNELENLYSKIMSNINLLSNKSVRSPPPHSQNSFSCNYYQALNIATLIRDLTLSSRYQHSKTHRQTLQKDLKNQILTMEIKSIKQKLIEAFAGLFMLNGDVQKMFLEMGEKNCRQTVELVCEFIASMKSKGDQKLEKVLKQIGKAISSQEFLKNVSITERVKLFIYYFLDWEYLQNIEEFSKDTDVPRISDAQVGPLKTLLSFDTSELFSQSLDPCLKAFLKILPPSLLPNPTFSIIDQEFFNYITPEIPPINLGQINENLVSCPQPIMRLDMFQALPILIEKAGVKEAMQTMNRLFKVRNIWNLNVIEACKRFEKKISQLNAEEQISTCLLGYHQCKDNLYLKRIHKLLVPERMNFILRLDAPQDQIERMQLQYPYLPVREIRSEDLQGDTIRALIDWVYNELIKLDQAMPLDIIVEKNIIDNIDLPIEVVYQHIAENKSKKTIGNKVYEYFRVIYRVQGILGEPKQRSIGNPRDQKLEACVNNSSNFLNKISHDSNQIGLDVVIEMLNDIQSGAQHHEKKVLLFEVLSTLSKNEGICKKIVEGQYGDHIINAAVRLMSFESEKDAKITNFLLELSAKVIDQANKEMINLRKKSKADIRKFSDNQMDIEFAAESEKKVRFVIERFNQCEQSFEKTGNILYKNIANRLIKLLPFCTKDEMQASNFLFNYFELANWNNKSLKKKEPLLIFMQSLSESFTTIKNICRETGVTESILKAIESNVRGENGNVDQKKLTSISSVVETALLLLCSLVQGDQELQSRMVKTKIFKNIYDISMILPKKAQELKMGKVPENCFKMIKYFGEGKLVDPEITNFLTAKKKEQKDMIAPLKKKKWEKIKEKQRTSISNQIKIEGEGQGDSMDFLLCSACQEGYGNRKQIMGLYIYFTKIDIPHPQNWWKNNRRISSYTSTTYFTPIHLECHNKAFQADQKIPRSEWDGALIRNMDVLCNGWIPFKGPKTTNEEFNRAEKKYFERNKNGNFWNVITDLNGLLTKLSIEFDFALESKGSSYSHNCRYIPILMSFACHMINKANEQKELREGVNYLLENPPKKMAQFDLLLCVSIFTLSFDEMEKEWKSIVRMLGINKQKQGWFNETKSHMIYLKLVWEIFHIVHKELPRKEEVSKVLETYIQENLQQVLPEFETLAQRYKTKITKYTTIEEFQF